jgi:single stranded DNA-binding protein
MPRKRPSENCVMISGNLGADAVISKTYSGSNVANLALAVETKARDTSCMWVDVTIFGKLIQAIGSRLKKGTAIYVRGELKKSQWTDDTGRAMSKLEVIAGENIFGSKVIIIQDAAGSENFEGYTGGDYEA